MLRKPSQRSGDLLKHKRSFIQTSLEPYRHRRQQTHQSCEPPYQRVITVPGNHDVRRRGISFPGLLRPTYEVIFQVGHSPIVIDDELRSIFFCFNSAERGEFARGSVSSEQRLRLASSYEEELQRRRRAGAHETDKYSKVALVHHHPFSYETEPSAAYDVFLRSFTRNEDSLTRFEQADEFLSWCAERDVSLILHGHKHVPHHIRLDVRTDGGSRTMLVVGCGSTTGAENSPLSYDLLSLDPVSGRWGVTFFYDRSRSGAGFSPQQVTIDTRSSRLAW